jgi:pimeloyl-ACP methyl ester carboxylesterase
MCRTNKVPKALQKSFDRASKVWAGTDVIANYEASGKVLQSPPVLATRGEYDFVSLQNVQGWQTLFDVVEVRELQGCSHIGLLENPTLYGKILNEFLAKHDIL